MHVSRPSNSADQTICTDRESPAADLLRGVASSEAVVHRLCPSRYFRDWLSAYDVGLALTTYELGRVVMIGAGETTLTATEAAFDSAMAILAGTRGLYLSTFDRVYRFQNALVDGTDYQGHDRLYLPQESFATGSLDIHDLELDWSGRVMAAATRFNSIVSLDRDGHFTPIWRPRFIDSTLNEDRCHLNGFCAVDGKPAFATLVGASNLRDGWREHRAGGGQVLDVRAQNVVASHLAMPHTPRFYRKRLWVLESGSGWLGWVDLERRRFERFVWLPGFLRGLRFVGDYAIVASSAPRQGLFEGLPLHDELAWRGVWPTTGLHVVNMTTGEVEHRLAVEGVAREIFDLAVLPGTRAPLLSREPIDGCRAESAPAGGR
jgi:uncharacterized protein (TIGR03032 family)